MGTKVNVSYQLRFNEDVTGAYDRQTYDKGDLFQADNGVTAFNETAIKGFFIKGQVSNTVGHGVTDYYSFPESFDIIRTIQQVTIQEEEAIVDPAILAEELTIKKGVLN